MKKEETYMEARYRTITKANALIQRSRFNLSLQQQKVVLYLISQISPYDEDFKLYEFSIQEFCKVCGMDGTSGKNYEDLKAAIKDISDKSIWITLENGKQTLVRWIEKPFIDPGCGTVQIRLDNDMRPYLLQLKANFTSYELIWTLRFKSKYTIRLYELIKSIHYHDLKDYERTYTVDELRTLLGAETYKTYQAFKSRVLVPAVEEINAYSDKNIRYDVVKKGRAVEKIRFIISSKDSMEALKIHRDIEKELGIDQMTLWDVLSSKGLVKP